MSNIIPDILNSRTERVILELPNYSYCHSSQTQGENHSFFLGRQSLLHKLKNLLSTAASKTGVYLVTGNRGVGKSRLVEEVKKETSIQKISLVNNIGSLFVAFFLTLGLQYVTNQDWDIPDYWRKDMFIAEIIMALFLFFLLGHYSHLRKTTRPYEHKKILVGVVNLSGIWHTLAAILKDFLILPSKTNPFLRTRDVLKIVLLLLLIQIISVIPSLFTSLKFAHFTHFQLFIIYLCAISGYYYVKYSKQILIQKYRTSYISKTKDWKDKNKDESLAKAFKKGLQWVTVWVIVLSILSSVLLLNCNLLGLLLFLGIPISVFFMHFYVINLTFEKGNKCKALILTLEYSFYQLITLLEKINHYIKNSSRVYLQINFGHDVLNERDVLRLITRILTTEYRNFHKSWIHTLYWRALALTFLLSISYLFYVNIYKTEILPWVETKYFYKNSSQNFYTSKTEENQNDQKKNLLNEFFKEKDKYCMADRIVNRMYCYALNLPKYFWEKDGTEQLKAKNNYSHAPINYAFLIIFFVFYLLGCLFLRLKLFTTHYAIKSQLKRLNENITFGIERELNISGNSKYNEIGATIGIRKKKTRTIADVHEIEKELQDILENIQKIPAFMARPEFVIVFDELDKISSEIPIHTQEGEVKHKETIFASNSSSERQGVILALLSNLKYFLSTANAKFIFIAGREMFDMYLADIADRNNSFGSIFNDVIFVPSFLTDVKNNKKQYDTTTLVEEYVCRHLIPEDYPNIEYNLKAYNKYLDHKIYSDAKQTDNLQVEMKKQKIIATLQQFIIYLAHTSKGAPKKIVQVFESFIASFENEQLEDRNLVVKHFKNTKLYLNFDYYDQYTIGMTSYLISPVLNLLSDANIQEHSDKLLVSTLHFVDYMMKFHNQNFSWRSIDISPELIEINHSPELKSIVNDIVMLFEQIHIHKPVISLFEFKFDALLAQEIFFLSKMDERFSAQFNFSLDESLILKEYYKKLLKEKQTEYEKYKTYGENYVSSIASLQIVLGDLHFFDDELDVAALYYKDGIYLLQKQLDKDKDKKNLEIFYLFIRNQLKLAYLYEKRKQPDFAYLLYGELTSLLVKYRDFDLEEFGISIRKDGKDFLMVKHRKDESIEPYNKNVETPTYSSLADSYIYERKYSPVCEWEHNEEMQKIKGRAKIRPIQFEQLTPITQQIMFKNMTFEGLQMLYLPLLAKLQILEKRSLVGILIKDIQLVEQEFEFLTRTINHSAVKIITADFYSKLGDILFYKNKVFSSLNKSDEQQQTQNFDSKMIDISHFACLYYKKAFIELTVKTGENEEKDLFKERTILQIFQENDFAKVKYVDGKKSTRYRIMMARVLSNLGDAYFQANKPCNNSCEFYFEKNNCDNSPYWISTPFPDCNEENEGFWNNWSKFINTEEGYKLSDFIKDIYNSDSKLKLSNVELTLFCYSLSMKYYRKANQHKHYAFQINKILNCLKYCLRYNIHSKKIILFFKWNQSEKRFENLTLVNKAIRSLYIAYDSLNMLEINKRKEDFDKFKKSFNDRDTPLNYIQVDSEVSRIRTTAKELELELAKYLTNPRIFPNLKDETVKKIYNNYITSPYHTNYSVSARIHRLRVKDRLNREAYDIMKRDQCLSFCSYTYCDSPESSYYTSKCSYADNCNDNLYWQILGILTNNIGNPTRTKYIFKNQIIDLNRNENKCFAILENLIADSIFCLDEILRLIKTAGDCYLFNHGFFASIYDRLAIWVSKYEVLLIIKDYCETDISVDELPKKFKNCIDKFNVNKEELKTVFEKMEINNYLQKFLGSDFKEQLSSQYYREQALAHYYQAIDTHNGGRSYLNLLEQMYFIKGDYDDVSSHFNVSLERFLINNSDHDKNGIKERIKDLKYKVKKSTVYDVNNYFEKY